MAYFDPTASADLKLLHASVRQHDELETVAKQAESDVVRKSRYGADETGEVREALRETIADVVSHRLRYYNEDDTLSMESRGSRTKSRAGGALDKRWPDGWAWRLRQLPSDVTIAN